VAEGNFRFGVLGPLLVEQDGVAVRVGGARQRSVLALLLLSGGEALSRDRLVDELWGERPPPSAVAAVHVHLSKLRAVLGDTLVFASGGYSLARGRYTLDVHEFDELVARAGAEPAHAASLLGEALKLFRGEPLADVACERSVARWRAELEERRLAAVVTRIDAELAAGSARELVGELEALVSAHPFEERIWGQLILALYRAGRQADALEAYQRLRRRFAMELGLEPGEPLAQLQRRILERDPGLLRLDEGAGAGEPPAATRQRPALPQPPTRLVGRGHELSVLAGLAADPDTRLITLTGPGGVGKTRLLLALAQTLELGYRDGVVFVALEQLSDPRLVVAEIAAAVAHHDSIDGLGADALARRLRDRELLLVLDNFEHLLDAAGQVAELIAAAPQLRVLVSSRAPLRIRGEQLFEVEPLSLPAGGDDVAALESPAVQLFLQCVAASRGPRLDPDLTPNAARICAALDGLPLAIELAASRARTLTVGQIERQLGRPLSVGERGLRDLPDRQQTLEAAIRWSYDLLTKQQQEVLRRTGVFRGGLTVEALSAVAGRDVSGELESLIEASLVRHRPDEGRLTVLELVRAFALELLEAGGEAVEARAYHRRYFASLAGPASEAFQRGKPPGEVAAPLISEHANLRSALDNAIDAADRECAIGLALGLRPLWWSAFLQREAEELIERVLARFELDGADEIALLRAMAYLAGLGPAGRAVSARLAARAVELGDEDALSAALVNLFSAAINDRDFDEMARLRPALLELLTHEIPARGVGYLNDILASGAYAEGDLAAALDHATRSVEAALACESVYLLANASMTRLLVTSSRDGTIPRRALAEVVECMQKTGVPPHAVFTLWFVARYAAAVAPDAAPQWLAHAERIRDDIGTDFWPESVLRDEAMSILGITDVASLLEGIPPLAQADAVAEAAAWLAERDPDEAAPRDQGLALTDAPTRA
jgi:predicted ATPase/DNA-binding SARP family transcriptional activator